MLGLVVLGLVALNPWTPALAGTPPDPLAGKSDRCRAAHSALSDIKLLGPSATEFCSSFLSIPGTVTDVVTLAPPVSLITNTLTVTISDPGCTSTASSSSTSPTSPPIDVSSVPAKRDVMAGMAMRGLAVLPTGVLAYPTDALSSACKRLSLLPTVTTTITDVGLPQTSTIQATSTVTVCVGAACLADGSVCLAGDASACCSGNCNCASGDPSSCVCGEPPILTD
ncbi:hypothetical protein QBC47DRAFT_392281 [Echria macrotheca]|uniref:Uncharacterized protein n=1 Tax=Echria macrotheca TaxID=438768 RepID=A0AAJ0B3S2_9PEZI|nr:hypothetical protein QBC47DRAFT_392281 [Echria macrotheca]